ncbi:hypothetical protein [Kingella oralis]
MPFSGCLCGKELQIRPLCLQARVAFHHAQQKIQHHAHARCKQGAVPI